ncbi:hypothetical protein A9Q74_01180 [Colwellia sp. 39_35_sub15_T18]|nr:hypothetical protein A9Q74_01180 [Colwellia sp. 39_35_sub15_T18]
MPRNTSKIENSIYRLFEITPIPIALSFPDGKLEYVNPAFNQLLGYSAEEVYADDIIITHHDDIQVNKIIRKSLKEDPFSPVQIEKRYKHKLGHTIYAQLNIVAQPNDEGGITRYISQLVDLTAIKQSDAAEILLNRLVNQSSDAIYVVEPKFGQIVNCNQLAYRRLGYTKSELLKLTVVHINPRFQINSKWQKHCENIKVNGSLIVESQHTRKDGTTFPIEANISFIEYSDTGYLLAIVRDIARRKKREQEALEYANLDPLTKLPNRSVLETKLKEMLEKANEQDLLIAFLYVDLDNFKQINDSYGHTVGDDVLVDTANRLKLCVRSSDVVVRLGGDEFLVVMSGLKSKGLLESVASKLLSEFNSPFHIKCQNIKVEASIGVSIYSDNNTDVHTLIQLADEAMYQAKAKTGSSIYFI